jgi:hypothetical protein
LHYIFSPKPARKDREALNECRSGVSLSTRQKDRPDGGSSAWVQTGNTLVLVHKATSSKHNGNVKRQKWSESPCTETGSQGELMLTQILPGRIC